MAGHVPRTGLRTDWSGAGHGLSCHDDVLRTHRAVVDEIKQLQVLGPVPQDILFRDTRLPEIGGHIAVAFNRCVEAVPAVVVGRQPVVRILEHGGQVSLKRRQCGRLGSQCAAPDDELAVPRGGDQNAARSKQAGELFDPCQLGRFRQMRKH